MRIDNLVTSQTDTTADEHILQKQKYEQEYRKDPKIYRTKVFLFILLGYSYLIVIALSVLGLSIGIPFIVQTAGGMGLIVAFVLLPLMGFAFTILRGLWVNLPKPDGCVLKGPLRRKLDDWVAEIQREVEGPKVHEILVIIDINAEVQQIPMLGIFGLYRNYLLLGAPLLQTFSEQEVRSVIAHELGHLSGRHSILGAWSYRVDRAFRQIYLRLTEGKGLFRRFANWYFSRFDDLSFPLRRAQEYDADQLSKKFVGADISAQGLCRLNCVFPYLEEEFWPRFGQLAKYSPDPNPTPFLSLEQTVQSELTENRINDYLNYALAEQTGYHDSHPCLKDRLEAIESKPAIRMETQLSALQTIFGETYDEFMDLFYKKYWPTQVAEKWRGSYEHAKQEKQQLEELKEKWREDGLGQEDMEEMGFLCEIYEGEREALSIYEDTLQRYPSSIDARYAAGRILIPQDEEKGVSYLNQVIKREPSLIHSVADILIPLYKQNNREDELNRLKAQLVRQQSRSEAAQAERSTVIAEDQYVPTKIAEQDLNRLRSYFDTKEEIIEVYLAEKKTYHQETNLANEKVYVMAFFIDNFTLNKWYIIGLDWIDPETWQEELGDTLAEKFHDFLPYVFTFITDSRTEGLTGAVLAVAPEPIYRSQRASLRIALYKVFQFVSLLLILGVFVYGGYYLWNWITG